MGIAPPRSVSILRRSTSRQRTSCPDSAKQVPVTSPTYPVPTTAIFTRTSEAAQRNMAPEPAGERASPRHGGGRETPELLLGSPHLSGSPGGEIGRASCRERV